MMKLVNFIHKHGPTILTCMNIGASTLAVGMAVGATVKSVKKIEEMEEEMPGVKVAPLEIIKTCAPYYIPSGVMLATSILCSIEENQISIGRLASAAGLYAGEVAANELYRNVTKEIVSDQKFEQIESAVAKKRCIEEDESGRYDGLPTDLFGYEWFVIEGQVFGANRTDVKTAFLELSSRLQMFEYVTVDEVFDELNDIAKYGHLQHTDVSNALIWSSARVKEIAYRLDPFDNGRVTMNKITFYNPPLLDDIY